MLDLPYLTKASFPDYIEEFEIHSVKISDRVKAILLKAAVPHIC
jgi:hypothetical protein